MVCKRLLKLQYQEPEERQQGHPRLKQDCLNPRRGGSRPSLGIGIIAQA
jgi:hypothetical protein